MLTNYMLFSAKGLTCANDKVVPANVAIRDVVMPTWWAGEGMHIIMRLNSKQHLALSELGYNSAPFVSP